MTRIKKQKAFLGIDPGKTGSACLLTDNSLLFFFDWPKSDNYAEVSQKIYEWNRSYNIQLAILEKVSSMPGQGVKSVFTFGRNYGAWTMLLSFLKIPHRILTPANWQKGQLTKTDGPDPKSRVKNVCCRLFKYEYFHGPRGGYKDGRGDACLMACKAMQLFNGNE